VSQIQNEEAKAAVSSTTQLKSLLGVASKQAEQQAPDSKATGWSPPPAPVAESSKSAKSLKEIMKQEEQQLKQTPESARPAPNSWAAKIGSGSSGGSSAGLSSSSGATAAVQRSSAAQPTLKPQAAAQSQSKPKELPVIRGMTPDMTEWCLSCIHKIMGPGFLGGTGLLEILVSLESPADIREIISETLGSVPQASLFASEFLSKRKGAMAAKSQAKKK